MLLPYIVLLASYQGVKKKDAGGTSGREWRLGLHTDLASEGVVTTHEKSIAYWQRDRWRSSTAIRKIEQ